jgi:hypothetical protein
LSACSTRPRSAIALQGAVRLLELGVRPLQAAVEGFELARLLLLQGDVGLRQARVRAGELLVGELQLLALAVELDEHRHLAAQDLGHDRHRHVIDRSERVAAQAVEVIEMHAGHEDDRSLLEARVLVDQLRRFEAVHVRHADVEQHEREFTIHQVLERLAPGARAHQIQTQVAQDRAIRHQPLRLVIHEQDADFLFHLCFRHVLDPSCRRLSQRRSHIRTSDSS